MEIISTTITARATANYQVGEVAIQVANHTEQDLQEIERYAISEAVSICNELQKQTNALKPEPVNVQTQRQFTPNSNGYQNKQTQQSFRNQQTPNNYQNNSYNSQDTRANRPVSEKQINYIRSLGWNGRMPNSFLEADELLKELKASRGIQ